MIDYYCYEAGHSMNLSGLKQYQYLKSKYKYIYMVKGSLGLESWITKSVYFDTLQKAWIRNQLFYMWRNYPNFKDGFDKASLKCQHGWVISSPWLIQMQLSILCDSANIWWSTMPLPNEWSFNTVSKELPEMLNSHQSNEYRRCSLHKYDQHYAPFEGLFDLYLVLLMFKFQWIDKSTVENLIQYQ